LSRLQNLITARFLWSKSKPITPSGERTDLAFMLTTGTGFELTKHLILYIPYRYTDLEKAQTDVGTMLRDGPLSSGLVEHLSLCVPMA